MTASKLGAELEGILGQRRLTPKIGGLIRHKLSMCTVGRLYGHRSAKLMLPESMGPFGTMERSQKYWSHPLDATPRFGGVDVSYVE